MIQSFSATVLDLANEISINEEQVPACASLKSLDVIEGPKIHNFITNQVNLGCRRSVRILTINIFMRPVINTNGSDHKEGRLTAFCERYLKEYDIICFQELFDWLSTRKQRMIREAVNQGFISHAFSP